MRPTKKQRLLKGLYEYLDAELRKVVVDGEPLHLDTGTCYTASKLARGIMSKLGYRCYLQKVASFVGNEVGREVCLRHWRDRGIIDEKTKEEYVKDGGWVIAIGLDSGDWEDSHYVLYFPDSDEILDLTFGQACRPEKGIRTKAFWTGPQNRPKELFRIEFYDHENPEYVASRIVNLPEYKTWARKVIKQGYRKLIKFRRK